MHMLNREQGPEQSAMPRPRLAVSGAQQAMQCTTRGAACRLLCLPAVLDHACPSGFTAGGTSSLACSPCLRWQGRQAAGRDGGGAEPQCLTELLEGGVLTESVSCSGASLVIDVLAGAMLECCRRSASRSTSSLDVLHALFQFERQEKRAWILFRHAHEVSIQQVASNVSMHL